MCNRKSSPLLKVAGVCVGVCALMFCCIGAVAQEAGRGGAAPNPEQNQKAWEMEAKAAAQSLKLSAELTTKLVDAYKAARESQMAAARAKMEQSGGGRPDFRALMEVNQAEKAKLETALKGFLNPEQTTKALAPLGTFNRRWDPMVTALGGMSLDEKTMTEAMKLVMDYIVESDKIMQAAAASGGFEAVREKAGSLREKLDADMAKVLPAEQMAKWKEATARRGGQGRRSEQPAGQPAPTPAPQPAAK